MKKRMFVTIEGPDGAGKSTQLAHIKNFFETKNIETIFTREPGGTEISEKIREIILDKNNGEMSSKTEALLYMASRAQHVDELIRPALLSGKTVVCDRYMDSSIVYQGIARGLGDKINELNMWATDYLLPDLTIVIVVDPMIGKARRKNRAEDRIENENMQFHQKVYEGYLKLVDSDKNRYLLIDGTDERSNISLKITNALERLLEK